MAAPVNTYTFLFLIFLSLCVEIVHTSVTTVWHTGIMPRIDLVASITSINIPCVVNSKLQLVWRVSVISCIRMHPSPYFCHLLLTHLLLHIENSELVRR